MAETGQQKGGAGRDAEVTGTTAKSERRRRNRLAFRGTVFVLIPFLVVLASSGYATWDRTMAAVEDLYTVARQVSVHLPPRGESDAGLEGAQPPTISTHEVATRLTQERFGDESGRVADAYRTMVATLTERLIQHGGDPAKFKADAHKTLMGSWWFAIMRLGILLLVFPGLFIARFMLARRSLNKPPSRYTLVSIIHERRCLRYLDEEGRLFFFRRLGFASVVGLATTYLLAPSGLKASAIREYVAMQAPINALSLPHWVTAASTVPPFVLGLAGFYVYAITTCLARLQSGDLNSNLVASLFKRGLVVLVLALVLSGLDLENNFARALVFVVGVFPQVGIQYLQKLIQVGTQKLEQDNKKDFAELPEIGVFRQAALREYGIQNLHELAVCDLRVLIERVGLNPELLLRAADRALLIHALGRASLQKLRQIPVITASGLVLYTFGEEAYSNRWKGSGNEPRFPVSTLEASEQKDRLDKLQTALGVKDLAPSLALLKNAENVRFIVDNRITYGLL